MHLEKMSAAQFKQSTNFLNKPRKLHKKEYKGGSRGAIQHLIYLIITSFGLDPRETWGFEEGELFYSFK